MIQNKLPRKLKDPGSILIPCTIGNTFVGKALCDSGSGINLMHFSVYKKLGLGPMREVDQILQFADGSCRQAKGIIDDVLVKVDHILFPIDFVVLEIEEDKDVPLILGRPFLATSNSLLDVKNRCLIVKVNDEDIVVDMNSNSE